MSAQRSWRVPIKTRGSSCRIYVASSDDGQIRFLLTSVRNMSGTSRARTLSTGRTRETARVVCEGVLGPPNPHHVVLNPFSELRINFDHSPSIELVYIGSFSQANMQAPLSSIGRSIRPVTLFSHAPLTPKRRIRQRCFRSGHVKLGPCRRQLDITIAGS